jgi:hypothetical protein
MHVEFETEAQGGGEMTPTEKRFWEWAEAGCSILWEIEEN